MKRDTEDFRDTAKGRQVEKLHGGEAAASRTTYTSSLHGSLLGASPALSLGRRIYAVVCWFHPAGIQLFADCRAFTVAGPKDWYALPEGTSAQSLTIFCQLKTWLTSSEF